MDVGFDSVQVALKHVHLRDCDLLPCALNPPDVLYRLFIFSFVQPRHVTRVEHCVDIFKHVLIDDLSVYEEEGSRFALNTADHQNGL